MTTLTNKSKLSRTAENKQFVARDSLLTELLQQPHIRTVYNIAVVALLAYTINATLSWYFLNKDFTEVFGLNLITQGFRNCRLALLGWIISYFLCIVAFFCSKIWATRKIHGNPNISKFWNLFWLASVIIYYFFIIIYSAYFVVVLNLGEISTFFLLVENIRLLMKFHSFARNVGSRYWNYKQHTDGNFAFPKLTHFVFYTFAPTLIYKDEYPRTKEIRWDFVLARIVELFGEFWLANFVVQKHVISHLQDFCLRKFTINEIIVYNFENLLVGALITETLYFFIMHSWQNLFAEITRFADRRFYEDWWCGTDYSIFFRKWNIVVHDWLHLYIYRNFLKIMPASFAKVSLFLVSGVIHDWIVCFTFGFFLPLHTLTFMCFSTLLFIRFPEGPLFNVVYLYLITFGQGTLAAMYPIEFYARRNCPIQNPSLVDYFVPRFLTCDCILY